ncbi:hypothetical protein [Mucilaginibacter segetis]|uniref:Auto-transporter adhesin head GIN domain-containing protein n=1 Tax=Mucilaginibacter segetis TaxID=2793071 RepID=A0A934PP12_9SPHI|nr:hypothetical protein [Mucilaginibacter segetis]MBK0378093.1 hypothetical protein [Mucilaginibacter segetis]
MKNIITFIMLLCAINAYAQTATKNHGTRLGAKPYIQKQQLIYLNNEGKLLILFSWIEFEIKDIDPESVDMDKTSFILQLDNKDILEFKANTVYSVAVSTNVGDILNIASDITKEQLKLLTDHRVESIRVDVNGMVKFNSVAITEENQNDVAKNAAIVLNEY